MSLGEFHIHKSVLRTLVAGCLLLTGLAVGAVGRAGAQSASGWTDYEILADSSAIVFTARHMAVLKVEGSFERFTGTVEVLPSRPDSMKARLEIDVASIESRNRLRDRSLRSAEFLNVEDYPTVVFTSRRAASRSGVAAAHTGESGRAEIGDSLEVAGVLHIRGGDYNLEVPVWFVRPRAEGDPVIVETEFSVRRDDVGLEFNSPMNSLIGDEVRLRARLYAVPRANATSFSNGK